VGADVIHVAVAAIFNKQGQVLLALRPDHVHQGGLWEFPGGKVEPGEVVSDALVRELAEELGLVPECQYPLIQIHYDYPDKSVLLDVWRIESFSDDGYIDRLIGREGQPLRWVLPTCLSDVNLPAANRAVVDALCLPSTYLMTPDPGVDRELFIQQLLQSLDRGVRLVRLRAWGLAEQDYFDLAQQVLLLCRGFRARLMISGSVETLADSVASLGVDGVHLNRHQLMALQERPVTRDVCLAASCHDVQEVRQACDLGVNFITVSPVFVTASHPEIEPLGWGSFRVLVAQANMPVYALGGLACEHVGQARQQGGQGIAAISSLWGGRGAAVSRQ